MIGMQLSLRVELDVVSQWVTKGLMGSVATSHGADVSALCLWMSVRTLPRTQLTWEAGDGGRGGVDRQSLSGRHIERSHMAATHSVTRVTRPCCLWVDWGLQTLRSVFTFWCQWTQAYSSKWWQRQIPEFVSYLKPNVKHVFVPSLIFSYTTCIFVPKPK